MKIINRSYRTGSIHFHIHTEAMQLCSSKVGRVWCAERRYWEVGPTVDGDDMVNDMVNEEQYCGSQLFILTSKQWVIIVKNNDKQWCDV